MELTKEVLEAQLTALKSELEKNYSEKLETEVKAMEERIKASAPVINRKIDNDYNKTNVESARMKFAQDFKDLNAKKIDKITVQKATNSQLSDGAGNYNVNPEMGFFIESVNDAGYIRANATIVPMTSSTQKHPYVSTSLSLSATTELDNGQQSNPVFSQVLLTAITDVALCPMSNQLLENSWYNQADIVAKEFVKQAAINQDAIFVTRLKALPAAQHVSASSNGFSSANTLRQTLSSSNAAFNVIGKLAGTLEAINALYGDNACVVVHTTTFWDLASIADANNSRKVIEWDAQGIARINGVKIFKSNRMTASTVATSGTNNAFMAYGNMENVILGDRMTMNVELFREGNVGTFSLLTNNATAWRGIQEYDVQIIPDRLTVLG